MATDNEAIAESDGFVGVFTANVLQARDVQKMARDSIVFALANPEPDIVPGDALPHIHVMATCLSDYPNQINNVLCFPGFFRDLLDVRAEKVMPEMKFAAAHAIADIISPDELRPDYVIPSVFDRRLMQAVATAVSRAAAETGVARRQQKPGLEAAHGPFR